MRLSCTAAVVPCCAKRHNILPSNARQRVHYRNWYYIPTNNSRAGQKSKGRCRIPTSPVIVENARSPLALFLKRYNHFSKQYCKKKKKTRFIIIIMAVKYNNRNRHANFEVCGKIHLQWNYSFILFFIIS